ncbi:hypothetical protein QQZ08_010307 [Neonectria magnoliae]|uniref:Uncharacterized protein n=1 Tax=Neonectria magnoliae TaxID=2732573 RepID=A0ABR1HHE8_9HYPO
MSIQHEDLALLVDSIRLLSQELGVFEERAALDYQVDSKVTAIDRLCRRGRIRRQLYERVCFPSDVEALRNSLQAFPYDPSEDSRAKKESCRVFQTTRALRADAGDITKLSNLSLLVGKWAGTGGFEDDLLATDIEVLLDIDIPQSWGSFLQACRRSGQSQAYDAYFHLVTLYRSAILRDIKTPQHSSFINFRIFEKPSQDSIQSLILARQPLYNGVFQPGRKKQARDKTKVATDQYKKKQMDKATQIAYRVIER